MRILGFKIEQFVHLKIVLCDFDFLRLTKDQVKTLGLATIVELNTSKFGSKWSRTC